MSNITVSDTIMIISIISAVMFGVVSIIVAGMFASIWKTREIVMLAKKERIQYRQTRKDEIARSFTELLTRQIQINVMSEHVESFGKEAAKRLSEVFNEVKKSID